MRDDFTAATKRTLAARAAHRCSNPDCRAVTSGPGATLDKSVNLGIAAHITAASPGGPRYDATLTRDERRSVSNGIWACWRCGTLIDSDALGYPVELLRRWKAEADHIAQEMLTAGLGRLPDRLDLAIPSLDSAEYLLSFASTAVARVGRDGELAELAAFLEDDERPFSWWLWTGPAGMGKSRLALELCLTVSARWQAGFLREASQERLGSLRTVSPTLVVLDYAAMRSAWLSDALFQLTQHDPGAPVRVLVLERDAAGPWWDEVQRHHRFEEASHVAAAQYAKPRALTGLGREDLRTLIRQVAAELGETLTPTNVEDVADHAHHIDPLGRPLFAFVATLDWLDNKGVSAGRDDALRRLLTRANSQMSERIVDPAALPLARNTRFLGSTLGGLTVDRYAQFLSRGTPPAGLLPGLYDPLPQVGLDELLDGLRPDILGELLVLDRLSTSGAERLAATELLRAAWRAAPEAYRAFVARATADHHEHPNLVDLLDVDVDPPSEWAWLAVDTIRRLRRSDHPVIQTVLMKLTEIQCSHDVGEAVVTAKFRLANLVHGEDDPGRANELFTEALASAQPTWPVYARILNNRGITWHELGHTDLAVADFTAVIDTEAASDEARACALNNRADHYEHRDLATAIADRTAVLALAETSYDRRYIALARRARARLGLGDDEGAYRDFEVILETPDIAIEQKMATRLRRAELYLAAGSLPEALADLEAVEASHRNFDGVAEQARALLEKTHLRTPTD